MEQVNEPDEVEEGVTQEDIESWDSTDASEQFSPDDEK